MYFAFFEYFDIETDRRHSLDGLSMREYREQRCFPTANKTEREKERGKQHFKRRWIIIASGCQASAASLQLTQSIEYLPIT
jgi:hypothetical protein